MIKKNYPVFEKAQRYEIAQMVQNELSRGEAIDAANEIYKWVKEQP